MPPTLRLPRADGTLASYTLSGRAAITPPTGPITSRIGMAAVHVVADPVAAINPTLDVALDWAAPLRYRHYVWSLGLAVAEAMDTSQRGMGFDWPTARDVIRRSVAEARTVRGAVLASGAGTDQLAPGASVTLADVEAAYEEQCSFIEGAGGRIILMASRALAACARGPEDYEKVYARILAQVSEPVIIHWLGDMFDPALAGYWGSLDLDRATETLLGIVHEYAARIDGVKISLLDQRREIVMRARFPKGVRMYTGDDFDYPTTIRGDGQRASDALLGIFDVIAPAASAALHALAGVDELPHHSRSGVLEADPVPRSGLSGGAACPPTARTSPRTPPSVAVSANSSSEPATKSSRPRCQRAGRSPPSWLTWRSGISGSSSWSMRGSVPEPRKSPAPSLTTTWTGSTTPANRCCSRCRHGRPLGWPSPPPRQPMRGWPG